MKRTTLRARGAPVWLTLALLAAGCGGGPERHSRIPLAPGQAVDVVYLDGGTRMTLRNATSVGDASYKERGLYGDVTPDVKLADQGTMQALVDALDELGLFARGQAQMRPGAKVALAVKLGEKQTVWSQPTLQPENMAELERFNTARMAVLQIHNNIISYHASRMSASDFDRALAEQNAKNRAAVENIVQKARGQGQ